MKTILVAGFLAFAALLLMAMVAALGWYCVWALKAKDCAATLAAQLGWKPIASGASTTNPWYGGVAQGRRVAIQLAALRNPFATFRPRHSPHLRIVMDVVRREPLGATALRSHRDPSSLHRFEEAFSVTNPERFSDGAQRAMMQFVAAGYPTGFDGITYRATPGTRNLWVQDREGVPESSLDAAVLPDSRTFLHHDHPRPNITQEEFGRLIYEMAQVAYAVEQGG